MPAHAFAHRLGLADAGHGFRVLALVMLTAMVVEIVWRLGFARRGYDLGGAGATLGVAAGHLVFGALGAGAVAVVYQAAWSLTPVRWPLHDWRTWAAGFLAVEFGYYWFHRLSHEVRWLWATHATHHSVEELTVLSSLRLGWTSLLSGGWAVYLPVILVGFDPRLVLALLAVNLRYQFFLHTEAPISLGPLEWALNSPAHHRVHHASNPAYLDRNYGGVLIVFDRLFGTFAAERKDEPPRFGLVHPLRSKNPFVLALSEWGRLAADIAKATSLRQAFRIAFGRPA